MDDLYDVIYADPPWPYRNEGNRGAAKNHYPTMSDEEIYALDIPAADDAVLFLWATVPKLPEAINTVKAWGFEYKSGFVWDKILHGVGFWARGQHELLLVAKRGDMKPPVEENRFRSVIRTPRTRHSSKPARVYAMIEKMYPGLRYLELFARERREGWDAWGNQVPTTTQKVLRNG
jgi:N6-adenosine-specific RNA methylase IME4